ncbi:hypothetical protein FRC10_004346 [Ceratobasidium sp. 414]|nr:hypothetical protein FRC10_004346 [Ceratobasidium sp. 414]
MDIDPPQIFVQWYHAGPAELLSSAPVSLGPAVAWETLTRAESVACEAAWNTLTDNEKRLANEYIEDVKEVPPLEDDENDFLGVPVTVDKLFEVNVKTMRTRAVEPVLSRELEQAYHTVKPYLPSYPDEVKAALSIGTIEAQDKLKLSLPTSDHSAVFQDACTARVFQGTTPPSAGLFRYIFGAGNGGELFPGATAVYRGLENAVAAGNGTSEGTKSQDGRRMSVSSLQETSDKRQKLNVAPGVSRIRRPGVQPPESRPESRASVKSEGGVPKELKSALTKKTLEIEEVVPRSEDTIVTDLVLVIHGIGQGYTAQYEAWDFTYATNLFRDVARKQSQSPALASIMRSRRPQFIPVPWRASMKLAFDQEAERERDGLDNRFTLSDITPKKSILRHASEDMDMEEFGRFVRELTNNVLIDIPYFMSQHRDKMIQSRKLSGGGSDLVNSSGMYRNRAYRLWCARNPEFESHGRVHILAHSLGSALSAHVLSDQPTFQRPLAEFTPEELAEMSRHFLFNTSHLFMIGSPLGVFMHINQAQLIARKGRERTMQAQPDEALDRTGVFGCLAVDAIYNIYNASDPISHAKMMGQTTIPSVETTVLTTIGSHITRMFDGFGLPTSSPVSGTASPAPKSRSKAQALNGDREREDSVVPGEMMDLGEAEQERRGDSRAERRFRALNPHGNVDFALPNDWNISEYVDMITAHGDYWSDPDLAAFVLTEIFARKEDLLRTGVGTKV